MYAKTCTKWILTLAMALGMTAASGSNAKAVETPVYPRAVEDTANKEAYAGSEEELGKLFDWYRWEFEIDPALDTVEEVGDGVGVLFFRLFVPESVDGEKYPVLLGLGGLGASNYIDMQYNLYASMASVFASEANQAQNPAYVVTFNTPFEACVNYEAELAYIFQCGEIAKWIAEEYGNVDMNRIYATGGSQGAGWSYELAAVQPDLLAAALINAGTVVHTTWGDTCDMQAIADSDINLYIWHGHNDPYIPVNEAYRVYNKLTALGKKNIIAEIADGSQGFTFGGHVLVDMFSADSVTRYADWLMSQVKGIPCTEEPEMMEVLSYDQYSWAGVLVLPQVEGWATANDYAHWLEPAENAVWDEIAGASVYAEGKGGDGKTVLAKIRIGDETATSYDDATAEEPVVTIHGGDVVAVTVQGYTGGYGDDWDAFNEQWRVDWAVLEGSVTSIELTCEASPEPVLRPETVTLANGGGPNVNNSLYNENTLDGQQVYVKINTADDFEGNTLKAALRFTRTLGNGEYASYYHILAFNVE